jgi:hypothetical protein
MFRSRYRLHRLHRFARFHEFGDVGDGARWDRSWRGFGARRHRARRPSVFGILLAGLAVFALVKLWTASNRPNLSTAQKLVIGALVAIVGGWLLSLRRSAKRYDWSI